MNKAAKQLVYLCAISLLGLACTRTASTPKTESPIEKARIQIDRHEYVEAITGLSALLEKNPKDDEARVVLASAYVHRAGVRINDYFVLEGIFREEMRLATQVIDLSFAQKLKVKNNSPLAKILDFLKLINQVAKTGIELTEKFQMIPTVTDDGYADINLAIGHLDLLAKPKEGMVLFRGAVKLMQFKYQWMNGQFFEVGNSRLCKTQVQDLVLGLGKMRKATVSLLRDLGVGFPKSKSEFEDKALRIHEQISQTEARLIQFLNESQSFEALIKSQMNEKDIEGFECDF